MFLCAGVGSRLLPLTSHTPKCLVDISGKTTLSNTLNILEEDDFRGCFYIVCGHASEKIYDYVENYNGKVNIVLIHNKLYSETNSLYSLSLVAGRIKRDTIILNGDLFFDNNLLRTLIDSNFSSVIANKIISYQQNEMNVTTGDNDLLLKISKNTKELDYSGKSLQMFRLNKSEIPLLSELIREAREFSSIFLTMFASEILNMMIERGTKISVTFSHNSNYWYELDNLADYNLLSDFIKSNKTVF